MFKYVNIEANQPWPEPPSCAMPTGAACPLRLTATTANTLTALDQVRDNPP
jgi:hypothetical protein